MASLGQESLSTSDSEGSVPTTMQSQSIFEDVVETEDDDSLITFDESRDFENTPWKWPLGVTCETEEVVYPAVSAVRKNHWRKSVFSFNFWRMPRTKHYQNFDINSVRQAFCKAGQVQLNVVAVMDNQDSCDFAKKHYKEGALQWPRNEDDWLGKGTFLCKVLPPSKFANRLHKGCNALTTVELNRVANMVVALDHVRKVAAIKHDKFENIYYVDPERFELSLINSRLFSPTLAAAYGDKFRLTCHKDGRAHRADNCQVGVQHSPIRVYTTRVMGGSAAAVRKLADAMEEYFDDHVPTRVTREDKFGVNSEGLVYNMEKNTLGCVCPSDEEVLSEMSHIEKFSNLFAMREASSQAVLPGATCGWVEFDSKLVSDD